MIQCNSVFEYTEKMKKHSAIFFDTGHGWTKGKILHGDLEI